jgi:acyl-CoA thioesterase-1
MNAILLYFADGTPFFVGSGLLIVAAIADIWFGSRAWRLLSRIGIVLGVLLVAISSTPLSPWFYAVWGVSVIWMLFDRRNEWGVTSRSQVARASVVLLSIVAMLFEFPYVLRPPIDVGDADHFVVIGDYISAGFGGDVVPWPKLLEEQYEVKLTDLSEAGAVLAEAASKAENLTLDYRYDYVFILEIGGNDILGGIDYETSAGNLERLLSLVCGGGDTVVLFELPLPPFYNRFAKAERDLAKKYGAVLIPRRYFSKVLTHRGATIDGIHLSKSGHQMMLDMVWTLIHRSEFREPAD